MFLMSKKKYEKIIKNLEDDIDNVMTLYNNKAQEAEHLRYKLEMLQKRVDFAEENVSNKSKEVNVWKKQNKFKDAQIRALKKELKTNE